MKKRIITAIILVAIFVPLIVVEELIFVFHVTAAILSCIGAYEMLRLSQKEKKYSWRVKAVIILSTLLIYFSGLSIWRDIALEFSVNQELTIQFLVDAKVSFALILFAVILQLSLLVFSKNFDGRDIGKSFAASFYVGLGVASIVALRSMGVRFIIYLLLITSITDVFAYFFGMLFGKHKMIERISPKKTWEGAIGGTLVATVVASLFAFLYGVMFSDQYATIFDVFSGFDTVNPVVQYIIIFAITLLASIVGQIGDLVASRLKRTYDVKDFGNIFPGHGGVLDRFDSAIYTSMFLLSAFLIVNVII